MLNAHVFPLVAHPGPAPELAARSGQGGWEPYALPAPNDRLLPFVLTRLRAPGQAAWLNCATIVDADTEDVLVNLAPTGQTAGSPPALGLVLAKVIDGDREHFLYYGALIAGLALPCGRPLRLLLDNAWQSARFVAINNLSGYQKLEWTHPGPLSGIPYGTGLVQRLYVENGGLQYAAPREVQASSQDATTGALRTDYFASYASRTSTVPPVPRFLADAVQGAKAHKTFTVDGEPWRLTGAKETEAGPDGGRWSLQLSLESLEALQSRTACPPAPLAVHAFDPVADAPRGWRCGDTSDTAPDWQTFQRTCAEANDGSNSGLVNWSQRDVNPYSAGYSNTRSVLNAETDTVLCPIPPTYYSAEVSDLVTRNNCPSGQVGGAVAYTIAAGLFSSRESQADADASALAYFNANKQAYANTHGTCTSAAFQPVYYDSGTFTGCFACQMVNPDNASDVRSATADERAQYFVPEVPDPAGSTIPVQCPRC
ncbi:DUF5977 domain-containing protein [Hymenobacter properus]|uniref:DUF5977 domain-containing protein n=1 Tax=Hymenobacter properus TaxID=2791026 RepID=A0A931BGJ5_9BACT|nr:DUF5977 domain-containing protein [Hymenobacter properus]MBF9140857.1 hypothetical protein [Hymenobacter properus]MBR7719666.1 hypothetical protein [Microvirga sp. SRT04]